MARRHRGVSVGAGCRSLGCAPVILSDRTLREQIAAGRIVIDPFDDRMIQPSSIDVRLDRHFRVFRNHTAGIIDVSTREADLEDVFLNLTRANG